MTGVQTCALPIYKAHRWLIDPLDGTTNFMLTAMEAGMSYEEALADAQARGYAEADPTDDVTGSVKGALATRAGMTNGGTPQRPNVSSTSA